MDMDKSSRESIFIKKYPLVFKKYRPLRKISHGEFSEVYYGINIQNNKKVALKTEYRHTMNKLLESESFFLFSLKGTGIPKVLSFGHNKEYDILIMPLLGKSLKELYISKNSNLEFKDICLISMQIIERIKWVHSRNIIHRDIKPDNFLVGLEDPDIIYLIDFGLSKKYKSSTTGKHINFFEVKKFTGSVSFASVNALKFKEQSRRDDLESICYMIIYLMKGSLPWQKIKVNNKKESYMKMGFYKKNIKPEKLCENLPREMIDFVNYVKKLQFEEEPDYSYLKNFFEIMLKKSGGDPSCINFSWVDEKFLKKLKKPMDYSKRSYNSRERIIKKIRNTLEYKRKQNTDYNLKIKSYLDDKIFNNIKKYDLSRAKTFLDNSNDNQCINYVNNSINNNYITINISISNDNNNANANNNTHILNSVASINKKIYGYNNNNMEIKSRNTNLKKYKEFSTNLVLSKEKTKTKIIPYIEYDINSNYNTTFKNYRLKDINKVTSGITYDNKPINNNKKISSVQNIEKNKVLNRNYNICRYNYNMNTINNSIKDNNFKLISNCTPKNIGNNNELMREIKNFNMRFNYGNNIKNGHGVKTSKKNKMKKFEKTIRKPNNKSEEQIKYSNINNKNKINLVNSQLNNNENNCFIF